MAAGNGPGLAADNSAAGLTAQLLEVWSALADLGTGLSDEDWERATACPGWPVSAQYAHVIGTESMLLGRANPEVDPGRPGHVRNDIGGFNEVWVAALAGESRTEVLGRLTEVAGARKAALEVMTEDDFSQPSWTPVGQADYRRFMQIRVFDCWMHEQDVRGAVGRAGHQDGPVAEQSVDEIVRALGFLFGKRAAAPDGSALTLRLTGPVERTVHVAVTGRAQVVDQLQGDPTTVVAMGSTLFTRLAGGRVAPAAATGQVELSGDVALGQRLVDNLGFTI
jgi:uncharacterized protein (TIGR03083 family)